MVWARGHAMGHEVMVVVVVVIIMDGQRAGMLGMHMS